MPKQRYDRNSVVQGKRDQAYSRLNVVRKELLKRAGLPLQQIVPLSVSQSVTCTTAAVQTQCVADSAGPGKPEPAVPQKMIVRKDGIEVESNRQPDQRAKK